MLKISTFVAACLLASASLALAATPSQPDQPATTGANNVDTAPAAMNSNGKARNGLDTAEAAINAKHGTASKAKGSGERPAHAVTPDRPAQAERPAMPERPVR